MGRGNDGKCKRALMPRRRPIFRSGSNLGELGISQKLLLFFARKSWNWCWMEVLWTGAYEREELSHLLFSTL